MSWQERKLDELGFVSRGRSRHRPRDAEHLYGGPYPFVQTADVKNAGLYLSECFNTYSEAGLDQSRLWPVGTLCITIAANIADTAILGIEACFPDSVIGFIPDEEKSDAVYLKYLFDAVLKKKYAQFTQGAAQDNLSQSKLLSIRFSVPNVAVQKKFASLLSKYDDLIENNQRRIRLLEESARLLYKEWFVHLRFPGHEHVKVKNGVPEGWSRKRLGDFAPFNYGKALKKDARNPGPYPVFGSSGVVGEHQKAYAKGPAIIIGRKGNVGSVYWSQKDFYPIDTVYFISSEQSSVFLYHALKNSQFISTDVAVPGLNRNLAHSREILVPNDSVFHIFEEYAQDIQAQVAKLCAYNESLTRARDLLLPKLMSGELAA